ncbi:MAG: hypothetical protein JJE25_13195, partial [Bacteroidia bacterium]|nr:hypothetical protein [Bacteroidia bacterium]
MTKLPILTLIAALLLSNTLNAQKIRATEIASQIGGGGSPAYAVMVYETDESTVEKEWKSLMKKNDGKTSDSRGVLIARNVLLKDLSNDTVTVYSKTEKEKEGIRLTVTTSRSLDASGLKRIMENFARQLTKESIADQQKDAVKELEKQERTLERLVRDNSDLHKDIERYNDKIKDAEKDIKKNLNDQEDMKRTVAEKRKLLDAIK